MEQELIDRYEDLMESDQSDAEVQYQLGLCYLRGIGVEQDAQAAERWLRRAADQDHAEAAALLRRAEEQPQEQLSPITEETLPEWCEQAEDGDAEAQYQVAKYLIEQNADVSTELESYLSAAVEQGHPMACLLLARQVWDSNPKRAAELLANASDCGITEAMQKLAECYAQGRGVRQDLQKAERWFVQAAEVSGPQEMLRLALRYEMGDGIAKNLVKSKAWLSRAKKAGVENVEEALAQLRETQFNELLKTGKEKYENRDYTEAVRLFQQAAELGNPEAMDWMGVCCYVGNGVEQDTAAAVEWYTRAAETGGVTYMARLAARYAIDWQIEQNDSKSTFWLDRAAAVDRDQAAEAFELAKQELEDQKGDVWEQINELTWIGEEKYDNEDYTEAVKLFRQAAELGSPYAMEWLGTRCYLGEGVERDTAAAEKWYTRAAEVGGVMYMATLAAWYATGWQIEQNDSKSTFWLDRAVALNHDRAMRRFHFVRNDIRARMSEPLFNNGKEKYNSRAYTEAVQLFQQAAELDHAEAMDWLGVCYHNGTGVKQNQATAEQWFLRAGETGGAREKAVLAARYATGTCLQQSDSDSKLWLDRAAAKNRVLAQKAFDSQCKTWNENKEAKRKAEEEQRRAEREQKEKKQRDQKRFLIFAIVALLLPWVYNLLCRFGMDAPLIPFLICFSGPVLLCGFLPDSDDSKDDQRWAFALLATAFIFKLLALVVGVSECYYGFFSALFLAVLADIAGFFIGALLLAIFKDEKK